LPILTPSGFRPLPEHELDRLDDERLIAHACAARDAGAADQVKLAIAILVFGYHEHVRRRVSLKAPAYAVDDIAGDALASAVGAAFDGHSVGQFHAWLRTIVDRSVANFFRRQERRPKEVPLAPGGGADGGEGWEAEPEVPSDAGYAETCSIAGALLDGLNDTHRLVVERYVFDGLTAAETAAGIDGMTEANVHQIAKRYRDDLRAQLRAGDT
jgi:DNA-directed RNA polymerase specialized sigma24 family protein